MKKYSKEDQKLLASWAADCAEQLLPFFEKECPKDDRPRKAIKACRTWVRTGIFKMKDIRGASLAAHAAARKAKINSNACFAARAAGQAVATAHVPQHAFGPTYYALKIATNNSSDIDKKIAKVLNWQMKRLPRKLKSDWRGWQLERLPKKLREHSRKFFKNKI